MTSKVKKAGGETTTYNYNSEDQLIGIVTPTQTISYKYDALGRRIEKNVSGTITRYIYDGEDIIQEYDGNNALLTTYTHGPGIDEPILVEKNGQKYYYIQDGLGSITALVDQNGNIAQTYRYDSFGNIINSSGTITQPFTYTGREYDSETGLYYYRARYMDPKAGGFLQEDPIWDTNAYAYCYNNPLNLVDPNGDIPLVFVIIGTGGLISGGVDAYSSYLAGGNYHDVAFAFGRGFISGVVGTTVGIGVGLATLNPILTGASAGLSGNLVDQYISNGGNLGCLDPLSAAQSTVVGGILGSVPSRITGLKTIGRKPNLFVSRSFSNYGKNSHRMIGQKAVGGVLSKNVNSFINRLKGN